MENNSTVVLVHTIFRHGERTTDRVYMYPKDPYLEEEFFPYGPGQLTNMGKKTMYDLGKTLRTTYNDFLGGLYIPQYVDAMSSDFDRTKMSLQLVLAALFPPKVDNLWHDTLEWQPIPYTHYKLKDDPFLGVALENEKFLDEYEKNFRNIEGVNLLQKYEDLVEYLKEHTGSEHKWTRDAWGLLGTLTTEREFGLQLPHWVSPVYPKQIMEFAVLEYKMQTATRELRRIVLGKWMHKILTDTQSKINGKSNCKIHVYSGHDHNIANFLIFFDLMHPHFPRYGSCIILEVHKIDDQHVMKLKYRADKFSDLKYLNFSNGSDSLDLVEFENMVQYLLKDE